MLTVVSMTFHCGGVEYDSCNPSGSITNVLHTSSFVGEKGIL